SPRCHPERLEPGLGGRRRRRTRAAAERGTFRYEATTLDRADFIEPFVELEPAFILRRALRGPNATVADVINAVEYVIPAIEIIDSRVKNWTIKLPDTLADN